MLNLQQPIDNRNLLEWKLFKVLTEKYPDKYKIIIREPPTSPDTWLFALIDKKTNECISAFGEIKL